MAEICLNFLLVKVLSYALKLGFIQQPLTAFLKMTASSVVLKLEERPWMT